VAPVAGAHLHLFGGRGKNQKMFPPLQNQPFNSLTPKSVLAGTKNSRTEGFLLVKHKHTNIPTMMEPFAPPAAWFCRSSIPHPREPLRKGLAEASVEGI
jgi:hypothetical protein